MNDKEVTNMIKRMLTNYETKIRPNYTGMSGTPEEGVTRAIALHTLRKRLDSYTLLLFHPCFLWSVSHDCGCVAVSQS